ncbi:hypothetical protein LTS18_008800, partial [Coniosporium uncinatum]
MPSQYSNGGARNSSSGPHSWPRRGRGAWNSRGRNRQDSVAHSASSHRGTSRVSSTPQPARRRVSMTIPQRASCATSTVASTAAEERHGEEEAEAGTDQDTLDEVIMAADLRERGMIGCAYYVAREEKLYFMEDVKMGGVDVVDTLKLFVEPTILLVSTKADDVLIDRSDPELRNRGSSVIEGDQFRLPYLLEIRPSSEFAYEGAKNKIINLKIPGDENGPRVTFITPGDVVAADGLENEGFTGRQ